MNFSFSAMIGRLSMAVIVCVFTASAQNLRGRIVDRSTLADGDGRGVAAAKLALFDSEGHRVAAKAADKNGGFRFVKLRPGVYTLVAEKAGHYPAKSVKVVEARIYDTLERAVYLDRFPLEGGLPARRVGKKKGDPGQDYYARLAAGFLRAAREPAFFREADDGHIYLSRFFDADDTTEAYRQLWMALLWTEVESQERPLESRVYMAHALDTATKEAAWPMPSAAKAYLKVDADSLEALGRAVRAMILSPSPKKPPQSLNKFKLSKEIVLEVIENRLKSALPLAKKRAFAVRMRPVYGKPTVKAWAALYEPKRGKAAKAKKPDGPPILDDNVLWQVVTRNAVGKKPNAVALYHMARRNWEEGKAKEAAAELKRVLSMRPDFPAARWTLAQCYLELNDTRAAAAAFDTLALTESTVWKARATQGLAEGHWKAGRAAEAEKELWRSLGLDANSDESRQALYLLARISVERDIPGAASSTSVEDLLLSLLKLRPSEAEAHYWLGRLGFKSGQDGVALDRFRKAAAIDPGRVEFAEALAASYHQVEECGAALKALRTVANKLTPKGLEVYGECLLLQGKTAEAVQELERRYAEQPSPAALALWTKAMTASGRAAEAAKQAERAREFSDPLVRRALAEARIELGEPAVARRYLASLLAENPNDPELHYLQGRCAVLERNYAEAYKSFAAALTYKADYPEALEAQGRALLKTGRPAEAHTFFRELADRQQPSLKSRGHLGEGLAFYAEEKNEAAEASFRRSYRSEPTAEAAAHLALIMIKRENVAEADEWIQKARKLDPKNPLILNARVDLLWAKKNETGALELAELELEKRPQDCDHLLIAAKANFRVGLDDRTKDLGNEAGRICPSEPGSHFYLGAVSARSGAADEARRHFDAYVRAGGDVQRVPENYR